MAIPKYVSPKKYSELTGMGEEEVKKQCRMGTIEHKMTEGGHYKIAIYDNDVVSREKYDDVVKENVKLKTIVEQFCNTAKQLI